ncbi:MAG: GAF domain-containing protein [Proteobacteria bacterium]|nr:GAF domain-containing protein [Pseudomonadota bacterium]
MDVGHEIIREQLFFRRELRERVHWFIKLRWGAACAGLLGLLAARLGGLTLSYGPPLAVVLFVAAYNAAFLMVGRRLESVRPATARPFEVFAHTQISLDLLSLFLLIHLTGGLASPLLVFVMFHVVLAGILLSPLSCYTYAILVILALGALIGLHLTGGVPSWDPRFSGPLFFFRPRFPEIVLPYLFFAAGVLIAAYLTTSIKVTLRFKGRDLMRVSRELEVSNAKLTSLYQMIREIGTHATPGRLMNSAVRNTALIMGVKACSIKLLDDDEKTLRFASTYGLSQDYLSKGAVRIDQSAINRRILEGSLYAIGHIDEKSYFQYPEDIRKEGIASMLCLPLRAEDKTLGVLCVYSGEPQFFTEADAEFFSLMTGLVALAMERLNREVAKTWFLNKAAHQLRSPVNAVVSMIQVLNRGYLGEMTGEQRETVDRCEKRLSIMRQVIDDLLKLAEQREVAPPPFYPVDLAEILDGLAGLYRSRAEGKGLALHFDIGANLPRVLATERLMDDLFANLISNAIKYTPRGGRIDVSLADDGDGRLRFEVSDTGIGIPEKDLPRLFSEFFRTEEAKAMEEAGTGLGLVIVRQTLDRLGGEVQVDSRPGQGSRFTCLIPAAPAPG